MLGIVTSGTTVSLFWDSTSNATGYILYYAPYPAANPIDSIDMKTQTKASFTLWEGASYFVAVQPYDDSGVIEFRGHLT